VQGKWAWLDAFDMLAPRYDSPQTIQTLLKWFQEAGMTEIVVKYGYNGIEGHGKRAISAGLFVDALDLETHQQR
jgi:hypothetical protein